MTPVTPGTISSKLSTDSALDSTLLKKSSVNSLAECGWRDDVITQPDGTVITRQVPLTAEEFLHPQEGYHLPNSTFHDRVIYDIKDMLLNRYADLPDVDVFHDLLIKWDIPDLKDHAPDICVVFGLQNRDQNRTDFVVVEEGVRPAFILEVVSPRYRKEDRVTKVRHYQQAQVAEYVIVDRRKQRRQWIDEVLGYRLDDGQYLPLSPDEDGRILSEVLGLWISLQEGTIVLEDAATGERLLVSRELKRRAEQAEERAAQAEERAERLAERLRAMGMDPDQL